MVANMTISSHVQKQPQHSPPRKGTAAPQKYAWLFKTDSSKSAKADMGGLSSMIPSPDHSSNSWETRAFAEDASSLAAGIWPPRAYPCSFCRREFRSAQALGGHMNVHRRDRARLRHSSPPPTPFCAPLTGPQSMSLFQAHEKYTVNPPARYPNESLIKLNSPPITLSKSSNLPTNTPYTSLTSSYRSDTSATSFPLCLQQLASEAAASLMTYPQPCESSDLLSLWPASTTNPASFACHSSMGRAAETKERAMEISSSSSFSSPPSSNISSSRPSMMDATPCRRDAPSIQAEDESPPKKSHTDSNCNHTFNHIFLKCRKSLKDGVHDAHDIQLSHPIKATATADTSLYSAGRSEQACGGDVDLELRLGQKPP